ncbi:MAG: hypothetical protein FWC32_09215 [Firmicutes bacterium]|nr:hypothetical protein [Bacillota bacterium]
MKQNLINKITGIGLVICLILTVVFISGTPAASASGYCANSVNCCCTDPADILPYRPWR